MIWLKSAAWVALCALVAVGLGWWLGQGGQDCWAPDVPRPTSLDPEALELFLNQLPWQAHTARIAGHALGLALGTVILVLNTSHTRRDCLAFGALMWVGVAFDMWRVPHPAPWPTVALATAAAAFWVGIRFGRRIRKKPDATLT
jgi:hypothetical protein